MGPSLDAKESAQRWVPKQNHQKPTTSSYSMEERAIADEFSPIFSRTGPKGDFTIAAWNVNGIRRLLKGGHLRAFLLKHSPDVLCLGEIKISIKKLARLRGLHVLLRAFGYKYNYWHPMTAGHGGHHGVALLCKAKPLQVLCGWAHGPGVRDDEGRVITGVFESHTLVHTYTPCSTWPERKISPQARQEKDDRRRDFDTEITNHITHVHERSRPPGHTWAAYGTPNEEVRLRA